MRIVASLKDNYVLAFYDCTRKRMDLSKLLKKDNDYATLPAHMMALFESQNYFKTKDNINLVTSYMSKPSIHLKAKPVNSYFFFRHIRD